MDRRRFLQLSATSVLGAALSVPPLRAAIPTGQTRHTRPVPASGEALPVIGMGTWITFNVGPVPHLRDQRTEVLRAFFAAGGGMIDSSPMYGTAEKVVGDCLRALEDTQGLFAATKVWTSSTREGREQVTRSQKLWGLPMLDLEQVHNLVNWRDHLKTLRRLKDEGTIRYLGITTSHGRRHDEFARIMRDETLDFVQLTYNIANRRAEEHLLGLAADRGIAVIANRPYGGGALIAHAQRRGGEVPGWAREAGCGNWPEFLLKWIVAHPAVTCAIPATSQVEHMHENMAAGVGALPSAAIRDRMTRHFAAL